MSFFGNDGSPLSMPLFLPQTGESLSGSTFTRMMASEASLVIQIAGQDSFPATEGSAQLTTTGTVSGFGIFRWTQFQQEASVPLESRNAASYTLAFDNTNQTTTGLALANVSNAAANVVINIRDDSGTVLQSASISLPANGHTSFMLPERYPSAANKRGSIEFVTPAGGRISVIGLRAGSGGTLTTIPVLAK